MASQLAVPRSRNVTTVTRFGSAASFVIPLRRVQEDALAERVEAGAAVHLALDHLDLVDGALDLAGVPVQGEAVDDGLLVVAVAGGEGTQAGLAGPGRAVDRPDRRSAPVTGLAHAACRHWVAGPW